MKSVCLGPDAAALGLSLSPQKFLLQHCWGMTQLLFRGLKGLFFPPDSCPAQSQAMIVFTVLSPLGYLSTFSSWLSQELFCILASDFSLFLSMAVHVFCFSLGILEGSSIRSCCSTLAVVQFQYNFTLKCKEPSLQLSKMKR